MVLKVLLAAVPLILPMEELAVLLEVWLAHVINPQVKAIKLIDE